MIKAVISACLLGSPARYDARDRKSDHPVLQRLLEEGRTVSVCPEMLGGLEAGHDLLEQLPDLVALYERSQEQMDALLACITDEQLAGPAPFHPLGAPEASLATLLQKSVCHEAYHAGQLGIRRRLIGKSGAIA